MVRFATKNVLCVKFRCCIQHINVADLSVSLCYFNLKIKPVLRIFLRVGKHALTSLVSGALEFFKYISCFRFYRALVVGGTKLSYFSCKMIFSTKMIQSFIKI